MKRTKRQFSRLAVYATSPAELRRALETVEKLASITSDLATLVGVLRAEIDALKAAVATAGPRRKRKEPTHERETAAREVDGVAAEGC